MNALLISFSFSVPIFTYTLEKKEARLNEDGEKEKKERDHSWNTSFVLYDGFCGKAEVT